MKLGKSQIESLHDDVDAIHCTAKMLIDAFKNDPDVDEFCKYEGGYSGHCKYVISFRS